MTSGTILIVDDDPDVLLAAELVLKQAFRRVLSTDDPAELPALLEGGGIDVVLLDMNFSAGRTSGEEGIHWLRVIRRTAPDAKVILMTAYGGVETAVHAIKEGATDFVVKPWHNEKLLATATAALAFSRAARTVRDLESKQKELSRMSRDTDREIIGGSPAIADVRAAIDKVAGTDASVLILGENGTGKELVARAIHRASARAEQPFLQVDLGAIPESLFESELFGHRKGAFTDAREDRPGRFEVASGGTLFLDEIGNLSLRSQAKLLGALETRTVTRVGSDQPIPIDVRVVCATNLSPAGMRDGERFRQDLLYRINTVEIRVPPLRERSGDVARLVEHYVGVFARKYGKAGTAVDAEALAALEPYPWPGNVRELVHTIERAVIMAEGPMIRREDLLLPGSTSVRAQPAAADDADDDAAFGDLNLEALEKRAIQQAVAKHGGNLSKAAQELGLGRTTLYRKMARHGL
jgi:two-component system, NtrC family, response regulator HydG